MQRWIFLALAIAGTAIAVEGGPAVRVGIYVDGFNLYYGARDFCAPGTAGWRWLDLAALAAHT